MFINCNLYIISLIKTGFKPLFKDIAIPPEEEEESVDPTERANVELKKHVKNAKPRVSTRHNGGSGGSFKKKGGRREAEGEYIWIDV